MKHLPWILAVLVLAACKSAGPPEGTPIVELGALAKGGSKEKSAIIKIPVGTRLPVDVSLDTPFVRSEGGQPALYLVYDKTVYWYPPKPTLLSFDGETWEHGYHLYKGKLNLGLGQKAGKPPRATFNLKMEER